MSVLSTADGADVKNGASVAEIERRTQRVVPHPFLTSAQNLPPFVQALSLSRCGFAPEYTELPQAGSREGASHVCHLYGGVDNQWALLT